jgi:hypothetical protein
MLQGSVRPNSELRLWEINSVSGHCRQSCARQSDDGCAGDVSERFPASVVHGKLSTKSPRNALSENPVDDTGRDHRIET